MPNDNDELWDGFVDRVQFELGETPNIDQMKWRILFEIYAWGYLDSLEKAQGDIAKNNPLNN